MNHQSGGLWREFKGFIKKSNTGAIFHIDTLVFIINRDEIIVIDDYEKLKIHEKSRLSHNLLWHAGQFKTNNKNTVESSFSKNKFIVPLTLYHAGLYIRTWKYGDQMVSATSQKHVTISDLYINNKLSKYHKLIQPVVVDGNDMICWIPGLLHGNINFNNYYKVKIINWVKR